MDATEIFGLESALVDFPVEFDVGFGRSAPRAHLRTYVSGPLSDLQGKSVEPIAPAADVPPRTLQWFLESVEWDQARLRDKLQQTIARDHADAEAIGIIDETGHPKKGKYTAGVKRQWCGNTGKVDNCVVSVHTGYLAGDFQSSVFCSRKWQPFCIKDSHKGPIVWEVKQADFHRRHTDGLPGPTHTRIIARNALDDDEVKYFAANVAAGSDLEKLTWLLHTAFSRFPIEHCFRQAEDELGMAHFEIRGRRSIHCPWPVRSR